MTAEKDRPFAGLGRMGIAGAGTTGARERRSRILRLLDAEEYVGVAQLAELYSLSDASVRRDLAAMEQEGLLTRVRGGAVARRGQRTTGFYSTALHSHHDEKSRIGILAASLIPSPSVAFFYSGTTVAAVAANLDRTHRGSITLVTNSEAVVMEVTTWESSHLVSLGGLYLPQYMAFAGPQTLAAMQHMRADVAIIGGDGLTAEGGLTTPHQLVAEVGSVMASNARRVIVVADSSKIGRQGFSPFMPTSAAHTLVTDSAADAEAVAAIRAAGVEVLLA